MLYNTLGVVVGPLEEIRSISIQIINQQIHNSLFLNFFRGVGMGGVLRVTPLKL